MLGVTGSHQNTQERQLQYVQTTKVYLDLAGQEKVLNGTTVH